MQQDEETKKLILNTERREGEAGIIECRIVPVDLTCPICRRTEGGFSILLKRIENRRTEAGFEIKEKDYIFSPEIVKTICSCGQKLMSPKFFASEKEAEETAKEAAPFMQSLLHTPPEKNPLFIYI